MPICRECNESATEEAQFCPACGAPMGFIIHDDLATSSFTPKYLSFGPFVLTGVVGRGATSIVYRATVERTGEQVALKVLDPALANLPGFAERLATESTVLASLGGPHLTATRGTGVIDGQRYLAMDYVEGASLRAVVGRAGRLTPAQTLGLVAGALEGLGVAHAHGLVHGDVKPENILVDRRGTATVVDFGQVVRAGGATEGGTPPYMSPEAARGLPLDARSDLYSMGVVLYEALAGRRPFEASNDLAILRQHVETTPAPIGGVSDVMNALILGALAKDPTERPQTAASFLASLEVAAAADYGSDWKKKAAVASLVAVVVEAVVAPTPAMAAATGGSAVGGGGTAAAGGGTGAGAGGVISSHPVVVVVALVVAAGLTVGGVAYAHKSTGSTTTTTSTTAHGSPASNVTKKPEPVLEAQSLYSGPNSLISGTGDGESRPTTIALAGAGGTNRVEHISWRTWGGSTATGTGTGCVAGSTGIVANCHLTPATVVAYSLGTCGGKPAYLAIAWYYPSLGQTFTPAKAPSSTSQCAGASIPSTTTTASSSTTVVPTTSAPCTLTAIKAGLPSSDNIRSITAVTCEGGWAAGPMYVYDATQPITAAFLLQAKAGVWVTPPPNVCTDATALGIPTAVLTKSPCRVS